MRGNNKLFKGNHIILKCLNTAKTANVNKEFTIKVLTNCGGGCIVLNVVSTQGKRVLTVLKAVRLRNSVREKKKYLLLLSNTI